MKNIYPISTNNLRFAFIIGLSMLTACVPEDDSSTSSSHDSVRVTSVDDMTVKVQWKKNYVGYSEVLSRESGVTERKGYFMTSNTTGSYEVTCNITEISSEVIFECINTGGSGFFEDKVLPKMKLDTVYNIQVSEGINNEDQAVSAKLFFNSNTQKLELRQNSDLERCLAWTQKGAWLA